ncbi:MAG: hypothetical protein P9F19_15870 [Candidatus Contendobacter sp.]|nr:hypothetical protein [Candidatus Contendobacter sp.]MDG4558849.1 hypothetical protein [Candidatus Contendobacter sp.]
MAREIVLRVRVDEPTDQALEGMARYNAVPKATLALHLLLEALDQRLKTGGSGGQHERPHDDLRHAA